MQLIEPAVEAHDDVLVAATLTIIAQAPCPLGDVPAAGQHDPAIAEGYATLGAGTRVATPGVGGRAYDASTPLENGTAAQAVARRVGRPVEGDVVVVDGPATVRANQGKHLSSLPGALGEAMQKAGRRTSGSRGWP